MEKREQQSTPLSLEEQHDEIGIEDEDEMESTPPEDDEQWRQSVDDDNTNAPVFTEDDVEATMTEVATEASEQSAELTDTTSAEHTNEDVETTMAPFGFPHSQFAAPRYEQRRSGAEEADLFVQFRNRWHATMQKHDETMDTIEASADETEEGHDEPADSTQTDPTT